MNKRKKLIQLDNKIDKLLKKLSVQDKKCVKNIDCEFDCDNCIIKQRKNTLNDRVSDLYSKKSSLIFGGYKE